MTASAPSAAGYERVRVTDIRLHRRDLADAAKRLQMAGEVRAAHRDAHARAGLGERPDHMAADKAGAAIDRDQG